MIVSFADKSSLGWNLWSLRVSKTSVLALLAFTIHQTDMFGGILVGLPL